MRVEGLRGFRVCDYLAWSKYSVGLGAEGSVGVEFFFFFFFWGGGGVVWV